MATPVDVFCVTVLFGRVKENGMCIFLWLLLGWTEAETPSVTTSSRTATVQQLGPISVGEPLPSFGGLTLDGTRWTLTASQQSGQYLVVSYMASWCAPCRVGLPIIDRFVSEVPNATAVYVAIGESSDVPIRQMASDLHLTQPILWDKFQLFGQRHGVITKGQPAVLPKTFIIAPDGTVMAIVTTEGSDFEFLLRNTLTPEASHE
mgnify:CR=1 FL=1